MRRGSAGQPPGASGWRKGSPLSFVLVTADGSYGRAEVAARGEARALDRLVESAEYAPDLQRSRIQADAVCYARAVRVQEWSAMADGNGSAAPQRVVDVVPGDLRDA